MEVLVSTPAIAESEVIIAKRLRACRDAYRARDADAYLSVFSKDLRYHQADGVTIDFERLSLDVQAQLKRISTVDMSSRLKSSERQGDSIIQIYSVQAYLADTAFAVLHRIWKLHREAQFTWREFAEGWLVTEVLVLREKVIGAGFQFRLKPRLPALTSDSRE